MADLKLRVPPQDQIDAKSLDPRPDQLKPWIEALYVADVEKSAVKLLELLRRYNRAQLKPEVQ